MARRLGNGGGVMYTLSILLAVVSGTLAVVAIVLAIIAMVI